MLQSAFTKYDLRPKRHNLETLENFLRNDFNIIILSQSLLHHVLFFFCFLSAFDESNSLTDLVADLINQPRGNWQFADSTAALAPPNKMLQLSPCKISVFNGFVYRKAERNANKFSTIVRSCRSSITDSDPLQRRVARRRLVSAPQQQAINTRFINLVRNVKSKRPSAANGSACLHGLTRALVIVGRYEGAGPVPAGRFYSCEGQNKSQSETSIAQTHKVTATSARLAVWVYCCCTTTPGSL